MADTKGRMERGGMSSAMGGPDTAKAQSRQLPSGLRTEGHPADMERSVKAEVEARGVKVGSEDFDAITGASPHVGPTAGGG